MYLLAGVFKLLGRRRHSQGESRSNAAFAYFLLGGFWLVVYYFACTELAGYLREAGYLWAGVVLLVAVNYLALDLLYGWPLMRRLADRFRATDIALLREHRNDDATK